MLKIQIKGSLRTFKFFFKKLLIYVEGTLDIFLKIPVKGSIKVLQSLFKQSG